MSDERIETSGLGFDSIADSVNEMFLMFRLKDHYAEIMSRERFKEIHRLVSDEIQKGFRAKYALEQLMKADHGEDLKKLYEKFIAMPDE